MNAKYPKIWECKNKKLSIEDSSMKDFKYIRHIYIS